MKHFLFALACLIMPSVCFGQQAAFADERNNVTIQTDLSGIQWGASRTIHFDNSNGVKVESVQDLPPGMGYIYIYNSQTRKGVIEFSRTDEYRYYPYLYDYSRHSRYGGRHYHYHRHGR